MKTRPPLTVERIAAGRYQVPCGGSCGGDAGVHLVTIAPDLVTCNCPAGVYRRPCRHVRDLTTFLLRAPLEPAIAAAAGPGVSDVDVPPPDPT